MHGQTIRLSEALGQEARLSAAEREEIANQEAPPLPSEILFRFGLVIGIPLLAALILELFLPS